MRQIVLDTETTGLSPKSGHRIIEIGCVELLDQQISGESFQVYLNPDRKVGYGAYKKHGISDSFLRNKPRFEDIVDEFMDFLDGDELIIHNARFDVSFIDAELWSSYYDSGASIKEHCSIIDTLSIARRLFRGQKNTLDALCERLNVDASRRKLHGALLDAEILADVYLKMI
ncbi:MAG: DNA polymerase III subunit epsilon [Crocinitomicaceae bacterium]|nr:DNA polymerase III subunit epsilon [Crocinitomicaceae bacterium]